MRGLLYAAGTALRNLRVEKWINLLTIITISICMMIIGICMLIPVNVHKVLLTWVRDFGIVVYLKEGITDNERQTLIKSLKKDSDFRDLKLISKDEALTKLQHYFSDSEVVVDSIGMESNPLPESLELKFSRDFITPSYVQSKVSSINTLSGVDDVQYSTEWLIMLSRLAQSLNIIGLTLGSIIFLAIAFAMYSTIKIHIYRRLEEIETLKLLGATKRFIKSPFLIEGSLIGLIGSVFGVSSLYGLYEYIKTALPLLENSFIFLPPSLLVLLPLGGVIISFVGTFIAIGRLRY